MKKNVREKISIIIPTYNRSAILKMVLKSLENQSLGAQFFEVLIVDDGSKDDTAEMIRKFSESSNLLIRYFFQKNKKQGAARNLAIKNAVMPLILFIGDDIVPESTFLENHIRFYTALEKPAQSCVIGYTTWPDEIKVTPFMRYIGEFGHQFGYSLINGKGNLPFNFFYTSNLLIPAVILQQQDYCFDEDFDIYGWEDIEFGFRLGNKGIKLFYNPDAMAYHFHPVDLISFCRRQENVGRASNIFIKKHPELSWFLGDRMHLSKTASFYLRASLQKMVVNIFDRWFGFSFSHERYRFILDTHYAKGATDHYN
ncbi:MAG: hypothetical protein B6I31_04100 [Desulfobacteraceae bacterium 4572_19]|nr:MAG: hypothetical protein B6I31_04100 [Desulfobacteraceae bacterium 4572_19]